MSRTIFTIFSILLVSASLSAQTLDQRSNQSKCTLTLSQSPAIRGFKLGMTAEQLDTLLSGAFIGQSLKQAIETAQGYPKYGVVGWDFSPRSYPPAIQDRLAGIDSISLTLFDGRVAEMHVAYAGPSSFPRGPKWLSIDDFIAKLSQGFALPGARDWLETSPFSKILKCSGLEIEASTLNRQGSISVRGNTYRETVKERAAADEERRRSEFKP
jgi:hypothetical protein